MFALSLILGGVLLFVANVLVWVNSTVFDSSEFVETVDDVFDKPEVKDRLTEVLVQQALESGEIEEQIVMRLPENLTVLEPVVGAGLEPALERIVRTLLDSELLGNLRNQALLNLHRQLIAILEDDESAIEVQGDALVLDLSELFQRVLDRLNVQPPERLGGADAPERLLGTNGTIVLLEDASGLKEASFFVENRIELAVLLLAGSVLCLAAAIFLASERRRGVMFTGYTLIAVGIVTLLAIFIGNQVLESSAGERVVLREGVNALTSNLRLQALAFIVLGAIAVAVTDRSIMGWIGRLDAQINPVLQQVDARVWLGAAVLLTLLLLLL